MSERESLFPAPETGVADTCYCPHAGPCCHSDHGCCGACVDEADYRLREEEEREDD